jgi:hypothetical protein
MKMFGRNIRYSPEETAKMRMSAIVGGTSLRRVAKIRVYVVTTEFDVFEKYRATFGFFSVIRAHLALGLDYLFLRLKNRRQALAARPRPEREKE